MMQSLTDGLHGKNEIRKLFPKYKPYDEVNDGAFY